MEADLAPRGHRRGHSHEAVERPGVPSDNGGRCGPHCALLNARRCSAVHTRGKVMMRAPSSALGLISLDHLIRPQQQRRRDGEAEGLGRLEVDDQFELRGLLDGEVGGFRAFEDLVHISRGTPGQVV